MANYYSEMMLKEPDLECYEAPNLMISPKLMQKTGQEAWKNANLGCLY